MISETDLSRPAADVLADALARVPTPTAAAMRRTGIFRRWSDGQVVLEAGTIAPGALLLLRGRLRLVATSDRGDEVLFRWFVPGEFVGLVSILGDQPLGTAAVADGDAEAALFERRALLAHLRDDAAGALYFAALVSRSASEIVELVVAQTTGSLRTRILIVLQRMARHESDDTDAEVRLSLSHQDLAHAVGASRQRVSVELQELERSGHIRLGYRHLVLLRTGANPARGGT
jgi:CRP-like cAMP-binding protein